MDIQEIKNIGKSMEDFQKKLTEATKEINILGKSLETSGQKMTKNFTIPLINIGKSSLDLAVDFDSSMSQVSAISSITGDDLDALKQKAREMGQTTQFSASESADAMKYMSIAGWDTASMLNGLDGVLSLAAISSGDLATTSNIVTDSLADFGLSAKDSSKFADILAVTSSKANTSVDLMGETFKYVGPLAGSLGYSLEDVSLATGLMAKAGIKGGEAGQILKNAIDSLVNPTNSASEEMSRLGIEVANSDGTMKPFKQLLIEMRDSFGTLTDEQKEQAAMTIFGADSMEGMLAILDASDEEFNNLAESINSADGAAEELSELMQDGLSGNLSDLQSNIEEAGIKLGELLAPALEVIVQGMTDLVEWFNSLDESTLQMIMTIAGILAAIGPLLILGGKLIIGFGQVSEAMEILQIGGGMLGGSLTGVGSTIASLALPIAIAVAAIIYMWNTSEDFRAAVGLIFEGVKDIFSGLIDFVKGIFSDDWELAFSGLSSIGEGFRKILFGVIDAIQATFDKFINWIVNVFSTDWSKSFGAIGDIINGFSATAGKVVSGVKDIFDGLISFIKNVFTGNWKGAWKSIVDIFKGIINTISGIFSAPMNGIIGLINAAITQLNKISVDIPDWVPVVGGKKFGFDIPKLTYLAKGGNVFKGSAIFGEAGPELLTVAGGTTRVTPLSGGGTTNTLIDYDQMTNSFIRAVKFLKVYLDDEKIGSIIDERLIEAVI